jgi:hypothetical protein
MQTATQKILFLSLTALILAALSSASGLFDSEPEPQPNFSAEKLKAMESGQITCLPQYPPSEQLWRCEDAYGNAHENLTIKQTIKI